MVEWIGEMEVADNSKELVSITLTKEQWEEIYQWYLVTKEDYRIEDFEVKAARKIASTLIKKFGTFR